MTADDPDAAPSRTIVLTRAAEIPFRITRWTWQDRLPAGALCLIGGREGIGKSLALTWISAQLSRGRLSGVHYGKPRSVIYAATEDSWAHTVGPRLAAADADLGLVYRVDVVEPGGNTTGLRLPVDCEGLRDEIERVGAAMVAIDPLVSALSSSLDTHKDRETRVALEPLAAAADATGAAIVGLAHHSKAQSSDANTLVLGSRAFVAVPRAVLAAVRDRDNGSVVIAMAKNNLGRMDLPGLRYTVESVSVPTPDGATEVGCLRWGDDVADVDVERLIRNARGDLDDEACSDRSEVDEWLSDYLACGGGEAAAADVFRDGVREGFSKDQLKRSKQRLHVTTNKISMNKGWVWRLPSDPEGGAKGVKSVGHGALHPSHASRPLRAPSTSLE